MKRLIKFFKMRTLGLIAVCLLFIPAFTLAADPALDSANLYKIANLSKPAFSNWGPSADADIGQTLTFMIQVHNKNLDSLANNVRVKAVLPTGEVTNYVSLATVSADNVTPVTGTTTFNISSPATIEYITGSTKLSYYNNGVAVYDPLPDGIVSGIGINVGNFQGCWQYAKWVIFKAKVLAPVNPTLYYCNSSTGCASTVQYKTTDTCTVGVGKPCYISENECKNTSGANCPLPNPRLYYCISSSVCTSTISYKDISSCKNTVGLPCYLTEGECKNTSGSYCPLPAPIPTPTPISGSLPVTGPLGAIAGILGTIGIGSAGYLYNKSRVKRNKAYKKF